MTVCRTREEGERIAAFQAAGDEGQAELDRGEGIYWTDTTMSEIIIEVLEALDKNDLGMWVP